MQYNRGNHMSRTLPPADPSPPSHTRNSHPQATPLQLPLPLSSSARGRRILAAAYWPHTSRRALGSRPASKAQGPPEQRAPHSARRAEGKSACPPHGSASYLLACHLPAICLPICLPSACLSVRHLLSACHLPSSRHARGPALWAGAHPLRLGLIGAGSRRRGPAAAPAPS